MLYRYVGFKTWFLMFEGFADSIKCLRLSQISTADGWSESLLCRCSSFVEFFKLFRILVVMLSSPTCLSLTGHKRNQAHLSNLQLHARNQLKKICYFDGTRNLSVYYLFQFSSLPILEDSQVGLARGSSDGHGPLLGAAMVHDTTSASACTSLLVVILPSRGPCSMCLISHQKWSWLYLGARIFHGGNGMLVELPPPWSLSCLFSSTF